MGFAPGGRLFRIAGASGTKTLSVTGVSGSAWHELQLHARVNGKASTTEVWLDGARVDDLSGKLALGSDPIGHLQVGDDPVEFLLHGDSSGAQGGSRRSRTSAR